MSGLIETSVDFVAADMPHANKVMIQMFAVMSEWERDQISERTKWRWLRLRLEASCWGPRGRETCGSTSESVKMPLIHLWVA